MNAAFGVCAFIGAFVIVFLMLIFLWTLVIWPLAYAISVNAFIVVCVIKKGTWRKAKWHLLPRDVWRDFREGMFSPASELRNDVGTWYGIFRWEFYR